MLKAADFQQKVYNDAMKNIDSKEQFEREFLTEAGQERQAKLSAIATAFSDITASAALKTKNAEVIWTEMDRQKKQTAQAALDTEKLNEELRKRTADQAFKALVDSGEWEAMTPVQRDDWAAANDSPAAATSVKNKLAEQHRIDEQVKAAENTPEYAAAVKSGDFASQLAIKAEAGSPQAEKELTKLLAKQATQKLDGSTDAEAQRSNDEAIANYSSPPPPQSARNKAAQKLYEDTMARVRKINKSYDPGTSGNAVKLRQQWPDASNKSGGQIQTYNTITHQLSYLDDLVDALETGDQATINRVAKTTAAAIGNPNLAVTDVEAARRVIADEITKGVIGSQGALLDRDKMDESFDPTQPLSVFKRNIGVLKNLVGGRFAAAQKSFESGAKQSKEEFWDLLEDDTKRSFGEQLGIPKEKIPAKPNVDEMAPAGKPATPAPAAAPATSVEKPANIPPTATETGTDNTGKFFYDRNTGAAYDKNGKAFTWDKEGNRVNK